MSLWRKDAKRDENEPDIVRLLELVGARVWRLPKPFDLLVGFRGHGDGVARRELMVGALARSALPECSAFLGQLLHFYLHNHLHLHHKADT
jgi:hypothetical protein